MVKLQAGKIELSTQKQLKVTREKSQLPIMTLTHFKFMVTNFTWEVNAAKLSVVPWSIHTSILLLDTDSYLSSPTTSNLPLPPCSQ